MAGLTTRLAVGPVSPCANGHEPGYGQEIQFVLCKLLSLPVLNVAISLDVISQLLPQEMLSSRELFPNLSGPDGSSLLQRQPDSH